MKSVINRVLMFLIYASVFAQLSIAQQTTENMSVPSLFEGQVRRSPRGKQVIAEKSGHGIHQEQPELVVDAIRQVVEKVKPTGSRRK